MIINDRFPTTYSDTNYPLFEYERTDSIISLGDGFKNYWLGYMNYDNIPTALMASEFSTTDDMAAARPVNTKNNAPVGYTTDSYAYGTLISAILKEVDFSGGSSNVDYLNSFHVPSSAVQVDFSTGGTTGCQLWCSVETGSTTEYGAHLEKDLKILSDDDRTTTGLIEFLLGNRDISLSHTINSVTVTHSLKSQDLEENGIAVFTGVANGLYYRLSVFIAGYGFKPYPGRDSSLANQRTYHINPCLKMFSEYGNYYVIKSNCVYAGTNTRYDLSTHTFYSLQSWGAYIQGIGALGGWDFSFTNDELADLSSYEILYNGNTVAYKLSTVVEMWRVYKPSDLIHHFALLMRIPSSVSYGYHEGIYCPEVLEDGEFTGNLLTGELTADDVQPWQWGNIILDGFKEENIPPYTPGDDSENIGDKITRPASIGVGGTNGFVTQYALNRADVAQLGALLWTSFVDQNYWQNYLFSLALDTGSFSLSSLLNFFVSLKVYPFSLVNIDSFSSWGQDMYIGTGIVPLHFSSTLHTINNYSAYVSGGTINIPRHFNDYRDYVNTEIILYLPFCGTLQLNPGDVIGNTLSIQYAIDFASGGCIAYVDLISGDGAGYPVGALPGQIGADVPLTATAAGEVAARFIGDGLNIAGMIGGEVGRIGSGVAGALGGNPSGGSGGGSVFAGIAGFYGGAGAAMAADMAPGLARQGLQMLQRGAVAAPMLSGGRGFAAFGAPSKPYVQIRRGIYPIVTGLHPVDGAPAAATATISTLSGFIQGSVKADGLSCHQAEKEEIIALIASGIYV